MGTRKGRKGKAREGREEIGMGTRKEKKRKVRDLHGCLKRKVR